MIKFFKENVAGTDYICGDIHGCFSLLDNILSAVNFDASIDRLFSLGDLINRGESSESAIEWLTKPWFHAILGNHEWMFIESFERYQINPTRENRRRIGEWTLALSSQELELVYSAFCKLPLAIDIELTSSKNIGLVHSQLPRVSDWSEIKKALCEEDAPYVLDMIDDFLWLKNIAYEAQRRPETILPVKNVFHLFHGHTIVPKIFTVKNRTFMDLGSYSTGLIGFVKPVSYLNMCGI